jgi:beta-phosphoglucomutase-like phosphatase (HAD superfamily)
MVDALLLEWEGVLADTGDARHEALLRALTEEGVRFDGAAYAECCAGLGVAAAARAALAHAGTVDPTLAELVALRAGRAFAARLAGGFSQQPGAAAFVAGTEPRTRIAVVTGATRADTDVVLRLGGLEPSVSCVVCADDVDELPPAPDLLERALAHLERRRPVGRERVVALATTAAAIRAARAAGLRVLAVGAPAHVAMSADAAVSGVDGLTIDSLAALLDRSPSGRPA